MATAIDSKSVTRDELKSLVRELMQEILWEMEQASPDPDEALELSPEFAAILGEAKNEKAQGKRDLIAHDEIKRRLGLNG